MRFFAATMIVFHHSFKEFGFGVNIPKYFSLNQAVSFFFILSGFILAYVYRSFEDKQSVKRFFIARVARVWPLHITATIISMIIAYKWHWFQLIGNHAIEKFWLPLFTNVFMIHSWIPLKDYFWSFNSVSWSISTEFGFYFLFPVLIHNFGNTWKSKLSFTFFLSILIVIFCLFTKLPVGIDNRVWYFGLISINPLSRLFEFTFGIFI